MELFSVILKEMERDRLLYLAKELEKLSTELKDEQNIKEAKSRSADFFAKCKILDDEINVLKSNVAP